MIILLSYLRLLMLTNKEFYHKLLQRLVKNMREKGNETHDGCGQMVVDFTIIGINYLMASLFVDLLLPLFYLYCDIRFCGCAICDVYESILILCLNLGFLYIAI